MWLQQPKVRLREARQNPIGVSGRDLGSHGSFPHWGKSTLASPSRLRPKRRQAMNDPTLMADPVNDYYVRFQTEIP
jgi:hypothetical protein